MPAAHRIHSELDLVVTTYSGRLTIDEILQDNFTYLLSPERTPTMHEFVDTSAVGTVRVDFEGLVHLAREILGRVDAFEPTVITAIWAPNPLHYNTARIFQRLTSGSEHKMVEVFRNRADAFRFLGRPDPATILTDA